MSSLQPKLQAAVPFTPVTGPRVLVRDSRLKSALLRVAAQTLMKLTGAPMLPFYYIKSSITCLASVIQVTWPCLASFIKEQRSQTFLPG